MAECYSSFSTNGKTILCTCYTHLYTNFIPLGSKSCLRNPEGAWECCPFLGRLLIPTGRSGRQAGVSVSSPGPQPPFALRPQGFVLYHQERSISDSVSCFYRSPKRSLAPRLVLWPDPSPNPVHPFSLPCPSAATGLESSNCCATSVHSQCPHSSLMEKGSCPRTPPARSSLKCFLYPDFVSLSIALQSPEFCILPKSSCPEFQPSGSRVPCLSFCSPLLVPPSLNLSSVLNERQEGRKDMWLFRK